MVWAVRLHGVIFRRLIAFPESRRIFYIHLLAAPFLAIPWALLAMVPVLLRNYFRASVWETTVSTAAVPIMLLLSVVWNDLYLRMPPRRYLLMLWLIAIAPLIGVAWCHSPRTVLCFIILSAVGIGAINPMIADILRGCYPPSVRGKAFSILQALSRATIMGSTYGIGVWLNVDHQAFRVYLPLGAGLTGLGMLVLARITRQPLFDERHRAHPTEPLTASLRRTVRNMARALAQDRTFRRYETAFSIYGLGWMICNALLPFLVVDRLKLDYEQIARATQTAFEFALILMMLPTGYLMDRLGPIRTSSWAFAVLVCYPFGLIAAEGPASLTLATLGFGVGISGVQLAWTIGPVTLARDSAQAPYYLAIHGTLVGFRALLGQFPAVILYKLVGIEVPLILAAALFATGAVLMHRLERDRQADQKARSSVIPFQPEHARIP